jgi:membrane protease YdiL (CAAX protease family)
MLELTVFVAVWIAIGLLLHLNAPRYQLVGVPLTVAFQLLVRRRPLRQLWVRDGPPFRLDARAVVLAAALLALGYPAYLLLKTVLVEPWLIALWMAVYAIGALAAAYALRNLPADRRSLRAALAAGAIGAAIGILIAAISILPNAHQPLRPSTMLVTGLQAAGLYFPAAFVVEEVSFRGLADAHVHHPGEPRQWLSALFVSALWGVWHLPLVAGGAPLPLVIVLLLIPHIAIGVPLSFAWRRSGNLALPGAAHALTDAVRDGLMIAL